MLRPFLAATSLTFSMICACSPGVTPILMSSASAGTLMRAAMAAVARNFNMCISLMVTRTWEGENQLLRLRLSKRRASASPALCTSCTSTISTTTTASITSGMKRW